MATLTGNTVQSTYESLIKIGDNTSGFGTLKQLSDGLGNLMPIKFSSTVVDFQTATTVDFTGVSVVGLTDDVGVASLEGLTGALTFAGADNITITDNGSNLITITGFDDTSVLADIATNAADIATNAGDIATNTGDIATNTADIASNLVLIGNNLTSINTNASNIISLNGTTATNAANIATNVTNISNNAGLIATNASDISLLDSSVNTNATNIATNASAITDLENGVDNVNTFNTLTGDVTISAGTNITFNTVGNDIEIVAAGGGGGTPGGSNTQVQYNDAGAFGGDADFTYDDSTKTLSLDNGSTISYLGKFKPQVTNLTNPVSGEIHPLAGSGLTAGKIYYLDGTSWTIADNTDVGDVKNLLGVAVSATEVMIRGFYSNSGYSSLTAGEPIYLVANGDFSETVPTTASEFIRCVGYSDNSSIRAIYFDPSPDYFELS